MNGVLPTMVVVTYEGFFLRLVKSLRDPIVCMLYVCMYVMYAYVMLYVMYILTFLTKIIQL